MLQAECPNFGHLLPPTLKDTIRAWLKEDIPDMDYGGFVVGGNYIGDVDIELSRFYGYTNLVFMLCGKVGDFISIIPCASCSHCRCILVYLKFSDINFFKRKNANLYMQTYRHMHIYIYI